MNYLLCVNHFLPSMGGSEAVCLAIANFLSAKHDVFVLTRKNPRRTSTQLGKLKILEYSSPDPTVILNAVASVHPDVIFVYSDMFDYLRYILPSPKAKLIIAPCGSNWVLKNPANHNFFMKHKNNISSLVCHSTVDRDYRYCMQYFPEKTYVIPNGVDLNEFDSNTLTRTDLAPDIADRKWIFNVSNFFPGKGQEFLLKILPQVKTQKLAYLQAYSTPDFELGRILETKWLQSIKQFPDDIIVKPLKDLPREKLIGFYKQSDVFTFTTQKEVAPLVVLESMAASLPWVSTDVGNVSQLKGGSCILAGKDKNGFSIFDNRVCSEFAAAIDTSISSPQNGVLGRKEVEYKYNWHMILQEYSNLFEEKP